MAWRRTHRSSEYRSAVGPGRHGLGCSVVVVGFDGSPASEHALVYANGVAPRLRGRLVIVNVRHTPLSALVLASLGSCTIVPTIRAGCESGFESSGLDEDDWAAALVQRIDEVLGPDSAAWVLERRSGHTAKAVSAVAHDYRADVVVVGKPRRRVRHPVGSAAGRIARHCEQPVLTVP